MQFSHWRAGSAVWLSLYAAILVALVAAPRLRADDAKPGPAPPGTKAADVLVHPAATFDLRIVGPDGKLLPDVTIDLLSEPSIHAQQLRHGKFLTPIGFGATLKSDIEVPGYAPHWAAWNPGLRSDPIPPPVDFPLKRAGTLRIRVLDQQGKPGFETIQLEHHFNVSAIGKRLAQRPVDLGVLTLKADNAR